MRVSWPATMEGRCYGAVAATTRIHLMLPPRGWVDAAHRLHPHRPAAKARFWLHPGRAGLSSDPSIFLNHARTSHPGMHRSQERGQAGLALPYVPEQKDCHRANREEEV